MERRASGLSTALQWVDRQRSALESEPLLEAVRNLEPGQRLRLESAVCDRLLTLQNLQQRLVLAGLLIEAALFRRESRGGHFRCDTPASQPFWRVHTVQQRGRPLATVPVGAH